MKFDKERISLQKPYAGSITKDILQRNRNRITENWGGIKINITLIELLLIWISVYTLNMRVTGVYRIVELFFFFVFYLENLLTWIKEQWKKSFILFLFLWFWLTKEQMKKKKNKLNVSTSTDFDSLHTLFSLNKATN